MKSPTSAALGAVVACASLAALPAEAVDYGGGKGPGKILGINVSGIGPLTTEWAFNDLMTGASPWGLTQDSGGQLALDSLGNPLLGVNQRAGTNVRLDIFGGPHYQPGTYTLDWDGGGTFFVYNPSSGTKVFSSGNAGGTATMNFGDPRQQIYVQIQGQNAGNPLRNLRITAPNTPAGQNFGEEFRQTLSPFGIVRYMPWMRPNETTVSSWNDRNRPNEATYAKDDGVPVERLVELANLNQTDPWFTMPTRADDTYVQNFAAYVRDNLDPGLTAYVEYGNEVWNPDFAGYGYLQQRAAQTGKGAQNWAVQWAEEADRDFDLWSGVFFGQVDRFKRVAAGQGANRFHSPIFLEELEARGGFDVLSMAAYFKGNGSTYDASTTVDEILDDMLQTIADRSDPTQEVFFPGQSFELTAARGEWAWHRELADEYGVPLVAYEGGQDLVPFGDPNVPWYDAYVAAQRDDRMYFVYREFLETYLGDVGADGFVHFVTTDAINQFGSWGAKEYQTQPLSDAPKYRALLAEIDANVPEPATAGLTLLAGGLLLRRRR